MIVVLVSASNLTKTESYTATWSPLHHLVDTVIQWPPLYTMHNLNCAKDFQKQVKIAYLAVALSKGYQLMDIHPLSKLYVSSDPFPINILSCIFKTHLSNVAHTVDRSDDGSERDWLA